VALLEIRGLSKRFGGLRAVHEVDLAPWATGRGTRALTVVIDDAMELTAP
jgi:hypothetical protein